MTTRLDWNNNNMDAENEKLGKAGILKEINSYGSKLN